MQNLTVAETKIKTKDDERAQNESTIAILVPVLLKHRSNSSLRQRQVGKLQRNLSNKTAALEDRTGECGQLSKELTDVKARRMEECGKDDEISRLRRENQELQDISRQQAEELRQLRTENHSLQDSRDQQAKELRWRSETNQELAAANGRMEAQLTTTREVEIPRRDTFITNLQQNLSDMQATVANLHADANLETSTYVDTVMVGDDTTSTVQQCNDITRGLRRLRADNDRLRGYEAYAEDRLAAGRRELDALEKLHEETKGELQIYKELVKCDAEVADDSSMIDSGGPMPALDTSMMGSETPEAAMTEIKQGPAPSAYPTPGSAPVSGFAERQQATSVNPGLSLHDTSNGFPGTAAPETPSLESKEVAPTHDIVDSFAAIENDHHQGMASRLRGQPSGASHRTRRDVNPQQSSGVLKGVRALISKPKASSGTQVGRSMSSLAAIAVAAEDLRPTKKAAAPVSSVVEPRKKPKTKAQRQREADLAKRMSDYRGKEYTKALRLYSTGDHAGLAMAMVQGRMIWNDDRSSMLYFSEHYDDEDIIMAQLGSAKDLLSDSNPCLVFSQLSNCLENREADAEEDNIVGFILQCALSHIPEVHLEAAEMAIIDDEVLDKFRARFAEDRGMDLRCLETRKREVEWELTVKKLTNMPEFESACTAWANREPSRGKWCWPPTFIDDDIIRDTSLDPQGDLERKAQEARDEAFANELSRSNLHTMYDEGLSSRLDKL